MCYRCVLHAPNHQSTLTFPQVKVVDLEAEVVIQVAVEVPLINTVHQIFNQAMVKEPVILVIVQVISEITELHRAVMAHLDLVLQEQGTPEDALKTLMDLPPMEMVFKEGATAFKETVVGLLVDVHPTLMDHLPVQMDWEVEIRDVRLIRMDHHLVGDLEVAVRVVVTD